MRTFSIVCSLVLLSMFFAHKTEAQLFSQVCAANLGSGTQQPTGLAVDANHNTIWGSLFYRNAVVEISQIDCSVIRTVSVGINPTGIATDGTNVWVANLASNTVTKIDAGFGAILGTFAVGSQPRGVTIDLTGGVWVSNYGSNTLTRISNSGIAGYSAGSGPYFLVFNVFDNNIYVPNRNSNTVTVLSATTGVPVRTIATNSQPQYAEVGPGTDVWVSCYSSGKIDDISTSGAILQTISSPHSGPTGVSSDGTFVYGVTNSGYVYEISANDGQVREVTFRGGSNHPHYDVVWASGYIFVSDFGGTIVKLRQ